ncbi:MAG: HNH endonuclease [bacterium]|nr:HNH endonuclease [bacterium]
MKAGTDVVYYKGRLRKSEFRSRRLTDDPHYFGIAQIGKVTADFDTEKNYYFAELLNFKPFQKAVLAKINKSYIEQIPENHIKNYWRDGVRPIDEGVFRQILARTSIDYDYIEENTTDALQGGDARPLLGIEGKPQLRISIDYERDKNLRKAAIEYHGTTCMACGFNFAEVYGNHGAGYIQVHHVKPLSEDPGERINDCQTDLIVLCANCHVMVHRYKNKNLSLEELKSLVGHYAK